MRALIWSVYSEAIFIDTRDLSGPSGRLQIAGSK
jgi:hypothetical protein